MKLGHGPPKFLSRLTVGGWNERSIHTLILYIPWIDPCLQETRSHVSGVSQCLRYNTLTQNLEPNALL